MFDSNKVIKRNHILFDKALYYVYSVNKHVHCVEIEYLNIYYFSVNYRFQK